MVVEATSYLKTFMLTCFALLLAIATTNITVDPFRQFGLAQHYEWQGINHQIAASSFYHSYPHLLLQRVQTTLKQQRAQTVMIGSSRTLTGFDTCTEPSLQKAAVSGITREQTLILLDTALRLENTKTVIIELDALLHDDSITPRESSFFPDIVSLPIFLKSIAAFHTSVKMRAVSQPFCRVSASNKVEYDSRLVEYDKRRIGGLFGSERIQNIIPNALDALLRQCNVSYARDQVVILISLFPAHPDVILTQHYDNVEQQINTYLRGRTTESCAIRVSRFDQIETFAAPRYWNDWNHFKPSVGKAYLLELKHLL